MRLPRALVLMMPVVLAPSLVAAAPASAAEDTKITISGKPDPAVHHDDIGPDDVADVVRHRGRLTTTEGTPIPNATVTLARKLSGGEWETVDGETDAEGRYRFVTYAERNARYAVRYDGDGITYNDSESAIDTVKVMRDFNAKLVEKERKAVLEGNINPGWNDKVVRWQHKKCRSCTWKVIAQDRTGDNGSWSFDAAYPPAVGKEWFYRATIDGDDRFVRSFSAELKTFRTARTAARTTTR